MPPIKFRIENTYDPGRFYKENTNGWNDPIWLFPRMPNGYRLATVEEVRDNLEIIKRRGLLKTDRLILLLDGRVYPDFRVKHTVSYHYVFIRLLVKEKQWDEEARIWKKKCSACYSSNGIFLRKKLFDGITLSQEARDTALQLAMLYHQWEVIYWLLNITNPTELERFKNVLERRKYFMIDADVHTFLFAFRFPFELPTEPDSQGKTIVDYAISLLQWYHSFPKPKDASIILVEMLIELYSPAIVHYKTRDGVPFLEIAKQNEWISVFTKLLSISQHDHSLESQMSTIKHRFGDVFLEAVERGYSPLVDCLVELNAYIVEISTDVCVEVLGGAVRIGNLQYLEHFLELLQNRVGNELRQDKQGKTLFHIAAESGNTKVFQVLATAYQDEYTRRKEDEFGRNFLHWAALNGQNKFCKECIDKRKLKADAKDIWGQNSLHYSAKGNYGHRVVDILIEFSSNDLMHSTDSKGRTPLHVAAAKGNILTVQKLLSFDADKRYIEQPDNLGRTAMQMAAGGGHKNIVQLFLDKDCDPFKERDIHGSTALHYAAQAKDAEVAAAVSQRLLNKYAHSTDKKSLLLWASAGGIGTPEEREGVDPFVKDFLLREKERENKHLLRAAAIDNNVEMAWELLNRGANIADIYNPNWKERLERQYPDQKKNVDMVISQIEVAMEQGRDKPSTEDNLGRSIFAEGLAALFLNRFVESPITVGISGEWGMGKSSLMIQTENILLMAASQLAFPNLLHRENFVGVEKISLNTKGRKIYEKIKNGVRKLLAQHHARNALVEFLNKYHPQYHAIYKSLACIDLPNQTQGSNVKTPALQSQFQPLRGAPRILTIRYNAWHYRDEHEAWAGLAVTITKEIEQAMTRAHKFSTCWKYSWAKNSVNICLQIFLPCLLVAFLAVWVGWAAWTLLRDAKFKDLKYGSIPCAIIAIVWVVLKSVISVVKPVSTQMMGYIISPDHSSRLGYQQEVISDINFLKGELGKKPHWFFSFISGEWCWNWFGLHPDNIENTCVPKFRPASEEQIRIITLVDDLDRCEEKVILQVLSAINLVLSECKINVILGMDKTMIERAVRKQFQDNDDKDLADKFICKIIQIPLSLPDPTDEESNNFLQHQLRCQPPATTKAALEDGGDTDYGEIDTDNDVDEDPNVAQESAVVDIDGYNRLRTSCQGITKKLLHLLGCFFQFLRLFACNILSDKSNDEEMRPLTFCKGARLTREMLLSNYSREEAETLYKLKRFATGNKKLPREWKRLLNYRTLAWIILCMMGKVYNLRGWKAELMAWIFICWQWKHEMNTLIKGWHKYAVVENKDKGKGKVAEDDDETQKNLHGPSLRQIVMNYVIELEKLPQTSHIDQVDHDKDNKFQRGIIETDEGLVKLRECLRQDPFVKAILSMSGHDTATVEESQTQYYNWLNLLEALEVQDVSMRGIQLFQKFRHHCETDHLPWPLPESNESRYKRLTSGVIRGT